jgi:hypothetical protein
MLVNRIPAAKWVCVINETWYFPVYKMPSDLGKEKLRDIFTKSYQCIRHGKYLGHF